MANCVVAITRRVLALTALGLIVSGCVSPGTLNVRHFDTLAIRGTTQFDERVEAALALLKTRAPAAYAVATNYVGIIQQGEHSGMRATQNPPVFELNERSAFHSVTWCAGVIAHDSFHSKLYHDHKNTHRGSVPRQVWTGHEAEMKCLEHQLQVLKEIGAADGEIGYCQTLKPDYADVPYRKRNW
jgi:hypothetical protein